MSFGKLMISVIMRANDFSAGTKHGELFPAKSAVVRHFQNAHKSFGSVAERLKALVLKTSEDESPS